MFSESFQKTVFHGVWKRNNPTCYRWSWHSRDVYWPASRVATSISYHQVYRCTWTSSIVASRRCATAQELQEIQHQICVPAHINFDKICHCTLPSSAVASGMLATAHDFQSPSIIALSNLPVHVLHVSISTSSAAWSAPAWVWSVASRMCPFRIFSVASNMASANASRAPLQWNLSVAWVSLHVNWKYCGIEHAYRHMGTTSIAVPAHMNFK